MGMSALNDWQPTCRCLVRLAATCMMALAIALAAHAGQALAAARTGTVRLQVGGLPANQAPGALLSGPGFHRAVTARRVTLRHLRPGRYMLVLFDVKLVHGSGSLRPGAVAYPARRRVVTRLEAGRNATLSSQYG